MKSSSVTNLAIWFKFLYEQGCHMLDTLIFGIKDVFFINLLIPPPPPPPPKKKK